MMLSKNFTLEEMITSQYASRHKIAEQFTPPAHVIDNLQLLVENILQPLRDNLGLPLIVSSGYRCERVNKAIGGAKYSQHLTGQAADIQFPHLGNGYLFEKIKDMKLPFDQLIWEYGDSENPAWVHVSYDPKRNRGQILTIK